jgi:hypothetical protein
MSFGLPRHLQPWSAATYKGDQHTAVRNYIKHSGISNNHLKLCSGLLYHIKNRLKKLPKNKMSFDNPRGKKHKKTRITPIKSPKY